MRGKRKHDITHPVEGCFDTSLSAIRSCRQCSTLLLYVSFLSYHTSPRMRAQYRRDVAPVVATRGQVPVNSSLESLIDSHLRIPAKAVQAAGIYIVSCII